MCNSLRHNPVQKQAETRLHPLCLTAGEARALVQSAAPGSLAVLMDAVAATPTPPGWELVPLPMPDGTWDCIATCGDWRLALDDRQLTAEAAAAAVVEKIKRISRTRSLPIGGYPLPAGIVTHPGSVREELMAGADVLTLEHDDERDPERFDGLG